MRIFAPKFLLFVNYNHFRTLFLFACSNSRKVQSFESHTNLAPLLNVLKNSEELIKLVKQKSPEIAENEKLQLCDGVLAFIRSSYSYYADNLMKPTVLNAISDVQNELCRLRNLVGYTI